MNKVITICVWVGHVMSHPWEQAKVSRLRGRGGVELMDFSSVN